MASVRDVETFTSVTGASAATARRFINGSYTRFHTLEDSIAYFFEVAQSTPGATSSAALPPPELRTQLSEAGTALLCAGLGAVALDELAELALQVDRIRERFDTLRFVSRKRCAIVVYKAGVARKRQYIVVVRRHRDWKTGNASLLIDTNDECDADGGATRRSIVLQHGRVAALHASLLPGNSIPPLSELDALAARDSGAARAACSAATHAADALARTLHCHIAVDDGGALILKIGGGAADVSSASKRTGRSIGDDNGTGSGLEAARFEVGDYVDGIPWGGGAVTWEGVVAAVRKNPEYDGTNVHQRYTYSCATRECGEFKIDTNAWTERSPGGETIVSSTEQARFLYDCTHDDGSMTLDVPGTKLTHLSAVDCGVRDRKIAKLVAQLSMEDGYRYTEEHVRAAVRARGHATVTGIRDAADEALLQCTLANVLYESGTFDVASGSAAGEEEWSGDVL